MLIILGQWDNWYTANSAHYLASSCKSILSRNIDRGNGYINYVTWGKSQRLPNKQQRNLQNGEKDFNNFKNHFYVTVKFWGIDVDPRQNLKRSIWSRQRLFVLSMCLIGQKDNLIVFIPQFISYSLHDNFLLKYNYRTSLIGLNKSGSWTKSMSREVTIPIKMPPIWPFSEENNNYIKNKLLLISLIRMHA